MIMNFLSKPMISMLSIVGCKPRRENSPIMLLFNTIFMTLIFSYENLSPVSSMVEREAFNLKATGSTPVSGLWMGCWRNWQRVRLQSGRLGVQVSHVP
ncbi:hypothetical protein AYI69_g4016 [Smittium culicis]|uniref:Uncharacterized protein n=1 Tax=Smittium culicis TaxID=133412 RepID=A0A1R1YHC4_9FUNG|nr:hypothetical protein AYI69_g4016 [Smittium culicis]